MRIAVDLMGGECAPHVIYHTVANFAEKQGCRDSFILVATPSAAASFSETKRIKFLLAEEVIEMHDDPLHVIRRKRNSSLVLAVNLLKEKQVDALLSLANTGALVAEASISLNIFKTISRPALLTTIPLLGRQLSIADVGANAVCDAENLLQFARLALAYKQSFQLEAAPINLALMNMGKDTCKGNSELRSAFELISNYAAMHPHKLNFWGNIEGNAVLRSPIDILITDGFTGNVFLKTAEGILDFILQEARYLLGKIPQLDDFQQKISRMLNGAAFLCGLDAVVVKCHAGASPEALIQGLTLVQSLVNDNTIFQIQRKLLEERA